MTISIRQIASLAVPALIISSACSESPTTTTRDDTYHLKGGLLSSACEATGSFKNYTVDYDCGQIIKVSVDTAADLYQRLNTAVSLAVANWNSVLTVVPGLPKFEHVAWGQHNVAVEFSAVNGDTTKFCGSSGPGQVQIYGFASGTQGCAGHPLARRVTDLNGVVRHELGHTLGWDHFPRADTAVAGCAMYVPETGDYLNSVCTHEAQIIYYVFGQRTERVSTAHALAERISLDPSTWSGDSGTTRQFTRTWQSTNSESQWGDSFDPPTPKAVATIRSPAIASFVATPTLSDTVYTIRANAVGTTWLHVQLVLDSTVVWPAPADSVMIIVPPPPPPSVDSIAISPNPVNVNPAGGTVVTGVAYDRDGVVIPGVGFEWTIQDDELAILASGQGSRGTDAHVCGLVAKTSTFLTAEAANGVSATVQVNMGYGPFGCW